MDEILTSWELNLTPEKPVFGKELWDISRELSSKLRQFLLSELRNTLGKDGKPFPMELTVTATLWDDTSSRKLSDMFTIRIQDY
jgi:hypothetical protein